MKASLHLLALTLLPSLTLRLTAAASAPAGLPRSTPEAQGISSSAILDFVETADRQLDSLHSVMLVRHGHVVAEGWWAPYAAGTRHELYSLSKSFTSTAVGLAIAEGRLSLDDTVLSLFPEDAPAEPGANLKAMRLRDLLCMSTGHEKEPPASPELASARSFLAQPVPCKPGTRFLYNTAATFMQSAMVQKATGQTVLDYLKPRLFEPLGITDSVWTTNVQGISLGGYGLSVRTEDIAKFGQLYLQKGRWQGRNLLPAAWVEAASARQTSNGSNPASDWDQGYGFQFWRCRHGAYRGDGAFGQFCLVMPEQDAVLAVTAGLRDMQAVLNLVWDRLLPAMKPGRLRKDAATHARLRERLAALQLRTAVGTATGPGAGPAAGRVFKFPANDQQIEAVSLLPGTGTDATVLAITQKGAGQRLRCGFNRWEPGRLTLGPYTNVPVAASGAWAEADTYSVRIAFYETPFCLTIRLRFAADQVFCDGEMNVGFGPTKWSQLVGRAP